MHATVAQPNMVAYIIDLEDLEDLGAQCMRGKDDNGHNRDSDGDRRSGC